MTQEGPSGSLRLLDAAEVVHRDQEVLVVVHLGWRIEKEVKEMWGLFFQAEQTLSSRGVKRKHIVGQNFKLGQS